MGKPIRAPLSESRRMTRWRNPTAHPWRMTLHVRHCIPGDENRHIPDVPAVEHVVVIEPGEVVELPSEFDSAIQRTRCLACSDADAMRCRNPNHRAREIVAGLGIRLVRVDGEQPRLASGFLDADLEAEQFERDERRRRAERDEAVARIARENRGAP